MNFPGSTGVPALLCWSGGKDSALALHEIRRQGAFDVRRLLTTVNQNYRRVSMHGVREELIEMQAQSLGVPLLKMYVNEGSNREYERTMEALLRQAKSEGIAHVIFGDIFLEDLRAYRERQLARAGMAGVFPLWKRNTAALMREFLALGFRAVTCCVSDACLGKEHVGVELDAAFLRALPPAVDPCGERGEFHTFCYAGPIFKHPVPFALGGKIYKPIEVKTDAATETKGFWFCDIVPEEGAES